MKPSWQTTLLWGAVAMASAQAHAERVVLTFDVTPTQRYEGSYANGAEQRTTIGSDSLTPFEIQYSFDTEHPWLDVPGSAATLYTSSLFHLGDSTASPHTAWLQAMLPPASTATWPLSTQVVYGHSITDYDGPAVPQVSWESMGLNTGISWFGSDPNVWESTGYNRGIAWQQQGPLIARQDFHALDAGEVIAWLRGNQGKTLVGAFDERVVDIKHSVLPSSNGDSLLYWKSFGVSGDVVLREVSVVPEPSGIVLALVGLAGTTMVVRRKRPRG